jgi:signal transduction histidine kinase
VPLRNDNKLIGYLQLELSLKNVDGAIANFGETMAIIAPFLLFGFGLAGYFFSSIAARPVEESFYVLQRFMADASHELNTPISIIFANTESIESDLPDNESIKTRLHTIGRSAQRMNNLVGDLMLLAKMESTHVLKDPTIVDLDKILAAVIGDFAESFKAKSIRLQEEGIQPIQIYGDAESLKRLITNLLQNALKYTDKDGTVKTSLAAIANGARLVISDTGGGISSENLPHIFDRFYRADPSRSRAAGGSGLGLSIVKAIIEAHKGKIEVESTLGVGTTFTVFLPTKK